MPKSRKVYLVGLLSMMVFKKSASSGNRTWEMKWTRSKIPPLSTKFFYHQYDSNKYPVEEEYISPSLQLGSKSGQQDNWQLTSRKQSKLHLEQNKDAGGDRGLWEIPLNTFPKSEHWLFVHKTPKPRPWDPSVFSNSQNPKLLFPLIPPNEPPLSRDHFPIQRTQAESKGWLENL